MFQEGDFVRIAKCDLNINGYQDCVGRTGVITHVYKSLKRNEYELDSTADLVWYEEELEPIERVRDVRSVDGIEKLPL